MLQPPLMLPPLRQDLLLFRGPSENGKPPSWLIYDPVRHRYFQISAQVREILQHWRETSAEQLVDELNAQQSIELGIHDMQDVCRFLYANNLADAPPSGDPRRYAEQIASVQRSRITRTVHSYLFFKVPLVRPHRFLQATLPLVAPLYSRAAFWILALITLTGLYFVSRQWEAFVVTFLDFLSFEGLLLYGLSLAAVKTLHELGHAYTATRAGARVNTMGVAFMLMFPLLYTDVTDAWRLKERRDKLAIDVAGIAVELAIAGVATFCWVFLPDGPVRSAAFILATTSWIVSLAINLNPFLRFDGYYLLSDAWKIANLQSRANVMARWWLRETLFGLRREPPEPFPRSTRAWLISYAIGVWIYRLFLFIAIALIVYHLFFKVLGVVLFAVEIIWLIAFPIFSELKEWWKMRQEILTGRRTLITMLLVCSLLALAFVPWSSTVRVPGVALAERAQQIYSPRASRVIEVAMAEGEIVRSGKTLAVLASPDLDFEIAQTQRRIALSRARLARIAGDPTDLSQRAVIEGELASHLQKLAGLKIERTQLTIRSPLDGVVRDVDRDLQSGQWVGPVAPIGRIVGLGAAEVQGYLHEDDLWRVEPGQKAVFIPEDPLLSRLPGRLKDVAPTGTGNIELTYLSSIYGGAVSSDRDENGFIRPRHGRYLVRVELAGKPLDRTVRGTIHLTGKPESLAAAFWRQVLQVLVRESGI